jgi:phage baseplate assembly protein W
LGDLAHLRQSIRDILTTPKGSRVMRRSYGSDLFDLVDAPMNRETLMKIYAATVGALTTWEPRILVLRVTSSSAAPGSVTLDLEGQYLPNGQSVSVSGITVSN